MDVYSIKNRSEEFVRPVAPPMPPLQEVRRSEPDAGVSPAEKQVKTRKKVATSFQRMQEIAHEVGEKLKVAGVNIQFEVNKESQRIVIRVLDPESGEVLREIPPESFMKTVEQRNENKVMHNMQGIELDVRY